jgi:hypothetical protein
VYVAASANNHSSPEKADPCNHLSRDTRIARIDLRDQSKGASSQRHGGKGTHARLYTDMLALPADQAAEHSGGKDAKRKESIFLPDHKCCD